MKNKKLLAWIAVAAVLLISAVGILFVTTTDLLNSNELGTDTVTFDLYVTVDTKNVIWRDQVTVTEGTTLIDALTANVTEDGGVVYSDGAYGAYITSICGHSENPDTNEYWVFTANGEPVMVGASDYIPADGDVIVFDLSPLVW